MIYVKLMGVLPNLLGFIRIYNKRGWKNNNINIAFYCHDPSVELCVLQ